MLVKNISIFQVLMTFPDALATGHTMFESLVGRPMASGDPPIKVRIVL